MSWKKMYTHSIISLAFTEVLRQFFINWGYILNPRRRSKDMDRETRDRADLERRRKKTKRKPEDGTFMYSLWFLTQISP